MAFTQLSMQRVEVDVLVYRCENPKTGQGPFNCDYETYLAIRPALSHVFNNLSRFPTFWGPNNDDRLGCETKRQFSYWFPRKSRETLSKQGFKLLIFDVPKEDTRIGPNQIAFKRDDKFKVAELDLDTPVKDWYSNTSTKGAKL